MKLTFPSRAKCSTNSVAKLRRWTANEARVAVVEITSLLDHTTRFLAVSIGDAGEVPISSHRTRNAAAKACESHVR